VPRARFAKLARGEPRNFTAIDGMRAPFYSHMLHKIVSFWDNSNCQLLGSRSSSYDLPIWPYLFCLQPWTILLYLISTGNPGLATHLPPLSSLFDTLTRQRRALQGVPPQRRSGAIDELSLFLFILGLFLFRKASPGFLPSTLMPSPAIFATRPQRPREVVHNRDPNRDTLRASVLDVALELGIGTSRAVENLIFDSVQEEDEVEVSVVLARHFPCFLLVYPVALELPCSILNGSCLKLSHL
jgi:hypothetical protein